MADRWSKAFGDMPKGRGPVVARLKKTCTLMQGFCLTLFIISLLGVFAVASTARDMLMGPGPDMGGRPATLVERLYLSDESNRGTTNIVDGMASMDFGGSAQATRGDVAQSGQVGDAASGQGAPTPVITNDSAPVLHIVRNLSMTALFMAMLWVGARFFGRIGKTGEPFRPERARDLTTLSMLMMSLAVVPGLLEAGTLAVGIVLLPDVSYDVTWGVFNYLFMMCSILVTAFSRIFAYGCLLQDQDDELV